MRRRILQLLIVLGVALIPLYHFASAREAGQTSSPKVEFNRDIQPILAAHCVRCHGPAQQMAGLRLDSANAIAAVVTRGNSSASRLIHRIKGEGGEPRMPMGGAPLTTSQIAILEAWVDAGAHTPPASTASTARHWAFTAPTRPAVPTTRNTLWPRNPLDHFILAEIEKQGLRPSAEAPRTTLIRRLSLDLTGLPPSPTDVDAFVNDRRPDAYERVVDRLLASPHYGERWGRWWLDAARYADSNGFEKDRPRSIWPYRDWVIRAFNNDLPFDRFTIEQIAGDLLPNATLDQKVATGFLRNSMLNEEGGVDPEQYRVEGVIDRVDAVGKAFLGLTIACAQCHNHKFDPIAQREYYQFYAFLNSDDEPEIEVPGDEVTRKRREIERAIAKIEDELIARTPDIDKRLVDWENSAQDPFAPWIPLEGAEIFAAFGVKFDRLEDGSFLARGDNSTANNYRVTARTNLKNIRAVRLELLTHPNLPRGGPGRAPDGSFYVTDFALDAAPLAKPKETSRAVFHNVSSDFTRQGVKLTNVTDGDAKTHWSSDAGPGRRNQDRVLTLTMDPLGFDAGTILTFQLIQKLDDAIDASGTKPNIGRFRILVSNTQPASALLSSNPPSSLVSPAITRLFAVPPALRTANQKREILNGYIHSVPEWAEANRKITDLMKEWPYGPWTMALARRPIERQTRIFRRGDWKRQEDLVKPGTPSILHSFPESAPLNRLGLARWIVAKENPLTARVIVNRIWQQYFGQGLVSTPEDFGSRSTPPSHPALLDYLALEFQDSGWSWKHLHRMIVTSATYRQSSKIDPLDSEKDPANRYLSRAPRFRVEAETVRDVSLAISGLLSHKIGGPSVYPPIPDGVLNLGYGKPMDWPVSKGEDRYRRGMYTFWKRSVPYPGLLVFDAPQGEVSCARRIRSNTPLQALTTLNDAVFVEAAQAFGLRIWKEGGRTDQSRMTFAFRLSTGRRPDVFELNRLLTFLREQERNFAGRTAAAVYVASTDVNNIAPDLDLHRIAPWVLVARLLLNLDETISRE